MIPNGLRDPWPPADRGAHVNVQQDPMQTGGVNGGVITLRPEPNEVAWAAPHAAP